jgi:hypothetical protein
MLQNLLHMPSVTSKLPREVRLVIVTSELNPAQNMDHEHKTRPSSGNQGQGAGIMLKKHETVPGEQEPMLERKVY